LGVDIGTTFADWMFDKERASLELLLKEGA
jgi:hypothetical protein